MAYDTGLAERVRSLLSQRAGFSERKMFGGICYMIHGHMCCGVLKSDLIVKLSEDAAQRHLSQPHVRPMDFSGKPMKSMLYVGPLACDSDEALAGWVEEAHAFACSQPLKPLAATKKPKKQPSAPARKKAIGKES